MAQQSVKLTKKLLMILFNLAILSAVLVTATCVFVKDYFTLSWFGSNKTVNANNLSVSVQTDNNIIIDDYTIYRYDQDDNLQADKYAIMRQYDSIFIERNVHNAIMFKIDVSGLTVGDLFGLNIFCTPIDESDTQRYISDIISLQASVLYFSTTENIYDNVITELTNGTYPVQSFRTIDDENVSTRTTVVTFDSLTMVENGSIYLLIDYDPNLIGQVEVEFGTDSDMSISYNGNITDIELFRN